MNKYIENILKAVPTKEVPKLKEVIHFSQQHLSGLIRRTGETYVQHGLEVAQTLSELTSNAALLRIAILHDLFLHTQAEKLLTLSPLNQDEVNVAKQMHALRRHSIYTDAQSLNQFIHAFVQDERILFLRMAHRLNDVRHLERFQPKLRKQIAEETLHMYTAIAARLGMHAWSQEMEDECFKMVNPGIAKNLAFQFDSRRLADERCLNETEAFLLKKMQGRKIHCRIEKRIKSLYSTYQKMILKERSFEDLNDRLAIRILVKDYLDCYQALGMVHAYMHPIPGKLKDYIGTPKENGYRSIHTVVYPLTGVNEQPVEIQIRTESMNVFCEFGPAAHVNYKKKNYTMSTTLSRVSFLRNIAHLHQDFTSPKQFEKALCNYFDVNYIAVFDAQDNLYHLKKPVTAIDFVYHVYPHRFKKIQSVYINGREADIESPLKDGDVIRPEFYQKSTPKKMRVRFSLKSARNSSNQQTPNSN